jgi:hypothetical protein
MMAQSSQNGIITLKVDRQIHVYLLEPPDPIETEDQNER